MPAVRITPETPLGGIEGWEIAGYQILEKSRGTNLRKEQKKDSRYSQNHGRCSPPVRIRAAFHPSPCPNDCCAQSGQDGKQGNGDSQQPAGEAPQNIDRRRCNNEKQNRCESGKKDVAEQLVVHI